VERDRLEDLVISLGMVNKIVFFGDVPDISVYLSAADIFVLSTCNEGFGISVIEACCAGLPVVATALGPLKDLHQAGLNLVLTKPGDVESLRDSLLSLANPTTRMCLGRQLRDLAPLLFSMERTARQYLAVYDELLAIKKPTRRELGTITRKPAESLANLK
jgi:glycosyltransferase involved in cell wall biosynthesis